jgi:hypothetical protein
VNDPYLRRLAKRLRKRIFHLAPQADRAWIYGDAIKANFRTSKIMIALSGFEIASLMWTHYRRLKQVRAGRSLTCRVNRNISQICEIWSYPSKKGAVRRGDFLPPPTKSRQRPRKLPVHPFPHRPLRSQFHPHREIPVLPNMHQRTLPEPPFGVLALN